ncbi:MAG: ribosomal protein large subunit ribosomal protein [Parcubacteria group bacterium]|nr:ribosomal protein large subunit ribosomal protein [Parcubacteria group bacterium]
MATAKKTVAKKAAPKKVAATPVAAKTLGNMEASVWNMAGTSTGTITLPEELFGVRWNADLVHQVVIGMQANARPTTAHTKFRGEVAGGGKKPWKQKGTGRARHGSTRSPIWKGGGVTHGPRAEKDYTVKINRKMRAAALAAVLSRKFKHGEIIFVDSLSIAAPKTAQARTALIAIAKASGQAMLATKRKNAAVVAFAKKDAMSEKSFRNINSLTLDEVRNLNAADLVTKKYLVIENPAEALPVLTARFGKKA